MNEAAEAMGAAQAAPDTAGKDPYPDRCDLVLKGGITSGVVYPAAIANFSKHYAFHQIGGTSAGAIAAAAAAAAELGRKSGKNKAAFDELAGLPDTLGQAIDGASTLFRMFRPTAEAENLFRTVTAAAGGGKTALLRVTGMAVRCYPWAAALGALPVVVGALVSPVAHTVFGAVVQVLLFGATLLVAVVIALLWALLSDAGRVLPKQGWGLCAGVRRDQNGKEESEALSSWLNAYFNRLAGMAPDEVLTFGHLWRGDGTAATENIAPRKRVISFKAMTTALNLQRPFIVPFEGPDDEELFFKPEDLRAVLPEALVQHMVNRSAARPPPTIAKNAAAVQAYLARGFLRMPLARDLPVLLAVRMSLSFPLLLSAVRLYKPDHMLVPSNDMQPLWFSDGGICSNLPVHLFDSPLPTHPTFTINLVEPLPPDAIKKGDVFVPRTFQAGTQGPRNYFHENTGLGGVAAFLMTIVDSARNWVDNGQLRLPGYRERVGSVVVQPNEGGLNLNMPQAAISALSERGGRVANELHEVFSKAVWLRNNPIAKSNGWDRHQWLRMRDQLGSLSTNFVDQKAALVTLNRTLAQLQAMVDRHPGTNTSEDRNPAQRQVLKDMLAALDVVLRTAPIAQVVDKSGGRLRIRPN